MTEQIYFEVVNDRGATIDSYGPLESMEETTQLVDAYLLYHQTPHKVTIKKLVGNELVVEAEKFYKMRFVTHGRNSH